MKRKFLPLFLTCALVLSSSMAFAADVNETVEGDALTTVSETQEDAVVEEETQEEVVTAALNGRQKYFDELRQKENIKEGDIPSFYSNIILCCMRGNGNERENEETMRIAAISANSGGR